MELVDMADLGSVEIFSYKFKSCKQYFWGYSSMVEQLLCKQKVISSSLITSTIKQIMKSKIFKDKYNRIYFSKEKELIIIRFKSLPGIIKKNTFFKKKVFFSQLKNRCILTSRSRSIFSKFRSSRILVLEFLVR